MDMECNHREMVRLLALIGQQDAALALVCDDASVRRTSPQLCARSGYVADKPADAISTAPTVMPPAAVRPAAPMIVEGARGFSLDNRPFVFKGGVWQPASNTTAAHLETTTKGTQP